MAQLLGFPKQYTDAESGCVTTDEAALQLCIQNYYQRQSSQQPVVAAAESTEDFATLQNEVTALTESVEELRSQISALEQSEQISKTPTPTPAIANEPFLVFSLLLTIAVLLTVIITQYFTRKNK